MLYQAITKYFHIYTYTYIYIYMYIYVCVCVCVCARARARVGGAVYRKYNTIKLSTVPVHFLR